MAEGEVKVEVERSPVRCPFCHDEVVASEDDWLACADCLARHHDECWRELGRCGTCASPRSLALDRPGSAGTVETVKPKRRRARFTRNTRERIYRAFWVAGVGVLVYLALVRSGPSLGCFGWFVAVAAFELAMQTVKGLLGLDRKRPTRRKAPGK